ncbi:hypothetical protein MNBD_BACTEROID03-1736 [hydrothermal vent metagenome]|uniref:DUF4846 domain-containing protein n=1 Tax=hydrothermal vent metagenome TaxID=652676 RepID=A0A3B0T386_9ZZZZ
MKKRFLLLLLALQLLQACGQNTPESKQADISKPHSENSQTYQRLNTTGNNIKSRFNPPQGYQRTKLNSTSFGTYLRRLPLKPVGSKVAYFNGQIKPNRNVYAAVVDLPIGKRDLHQCADAVMRLRADYLFSQKEYDSIHFNFTNGFRADYTNWRKGKRIVVSGNNVSWRQKTQASDSKKDFWEYLEMVFSYAGTASLSEEMKSIPIEELRIGDVFIQGGFPGHAVIVVDIAIDQNTNNKVFMLAQSYMPAQEIQIIKNPNNVDLSPWYDSDILDLLQTPEWTFKKTDLKRFVN